MAEDIYLEVMKLLNGARALTPGNNRVVLEQRLDDLGLRPVFNAYLRDHFGKTRIADLSNDEVTEAQDYVTSISRILSEAPDKSQ